MGLQKLFGDIGALGDKAVKAVSEGAVKFDDFTKKPAEEQDAAITAATDKTLKTIHSGAVTGLEKITAIVKDPAAAKEKVASFFKGDKPSGRDGP